MEALELEIRPESHGMTAAIPAGPEPAPEIAPNGRAGDPKLVGAATPDSLLEHWWESLG